MAHATSFSVSVVGQSLIKDDVLAHAGSDFLDVVKLVRESDFAFTGFEGTIRGRHGGWPMKASFLHASEPLVLDCLKSIGFNLLSLSNNHAFDLGPGGVLSTIEEAKKRGFAHAGTGETLTSAMRPGVLRTQAGSVALIAMDAGPQGDHVYALDTTRRIPARPGSNRLRVHTTIAIPPRELDALRELSRKLGHEQSKAANDKVGYKQTPGQGFEFYGLRFEPAAEPHERRRVDPEDAERNLRAVAEAAGEADRVIVYVHHHHCEPRWEVVPQWFQQFARQCVDAGAGLVVSHGVPMLQGIEIYRGAPLFYGLGNFIFHTFQPAKYTDARTWQSVVAKALFSNGQCTQIELYPIVIGGEAAIRAERYESRRVPHLARGEYGKGILQRLADMSAGFGACIEIENGRGVIRTG